MQLLENHVEYRKMNTKTHSSSFQCDIDYVSGRFADKKKQTHTRKTHGTSSKELLKALNHVHFEEQAKMKLIFTEIKNRLGKWKISNHSENWYYSQEKQISSEKIRQIFKKFAENVIFVLI